MSATLSTIVNFFRPLWAKVLLGLLLLAILIAVGYYVRQFIATDTLLKKLPGDNVSITFTEQGFADRFMSSGLGFVQESAVTVGDVTILETVPSPVTDGERVVLAVKKDVPGTLLGILKADGAFETIFSDPSMKTDLTVTESGTAVYSVLSGPVFFAEDFTPGPVSDEAPLLEYPEEVGTADGPVDFGVPIAEDVPQHEGALFAVNLTGTREKKSLGEGRSPRLADDGVLIAVTSEGIVRINVESGMRTKVVSYISGDAAGSGISRDGKLAALYRENNNIIDVYRLVGIENAYLGSLFVSGPVFGIALVDEQHIFVRNGKDRISLYHLPLDVNSIQPPDAHLRLITP